MNKKAQKPHILVRGSGKNLIVIIHGWGGSSESWHKVLANLERSLDKKQFTILVPDLPGFGKSPEPPTIWNIHDYSNFILDLLQQHKSRSVTLIGHSFGGQIAAYCAILHPELITNLILIDAACIRRRSLITTIISALNSSSKKHLKKLFMFVPPTKKIITKILKNYDFEKASGHMKEIMKLVLKEDLTNMLEKITAPTTIIWGANDRTTPPSDALVIKNKIPHATTLFINDARHSPHLTHPTIVAEQIVNVVIPFSRHE